MDDPAYRRDSNFGGTFDRCPPLGRRPGNSPNLMGMRFGTLTAIGYYVSDSAHSRKGQSGRGNPLWVVRCDCGTYELRPAKTIRKHSAEDGSVGKTACCRRCHEKRKEGSLPCATTASTA